MDYRTDAPSPREFLIAVIFLIALGLVVVPQFTEATFHMRTAELTSNLTTLRGAIALYRIHHNGELPRLATFAQQLTDSNGDWEWSSDGPYPRQTAGPYLRFVPKNPYHGDNSIGTGPPGTSAWYYDETTGKLRANDSPANREL